MPRYTGPIVLKTAAQMVVENAMRSLVDAMIAAEPDRKGRIVLHTRLNPCTRISEELGGTQDLYAMVDVQ